jgi:GT2 family glycosyltransferase
MTDAPSEPQRLSVLIPTHGRTPLLARTLDSLAACRLPDAYAETVVVENGSRDGAEQIVTEAARTHPALRLRYLHVERANKSHALNVALETMADGLVVFFDDDIRLEPGALDAYARAAAAGPGHFFGGPFGVDYEVPPAAWLLPHLPFSARGVRFDEGERPDDYLGCNWAARKADLLRVGGFDPAFGPGSTSGASGQEAEMQWRLRAAGLVPFDVPGALVWHFVPRTRCSPSWAAGRRYRKGIAMGRSKRDQWSRVGLRSLMLAGRSCLSWTKQAIRGSESGRWQALFGFHYHRGVLRGVLQRPPAADQ